MRAISYRDFLPGESERGGIFGGVDYASFDSCVADMNAWLVENPVELLRIETVTLPNIHNVAEQGTKDTELNATGHAVWYQFLRLWYYVD